MARPSVSRKSKYPISKEFFPLTLFTAPMNPKIIAYAQKYMGVPQFVWNDKELVVVSHKIKSYDDSCIEALVMTPKDIGRNAPCLIDIHGGGFVFEAAPYHYKLAMAYAKEAHCIVVFVRYRLAPAHPFPIPQEDCFAAASWVFGNAHKLGIDPARVGIGGDSAGSALAVATCLMMRNRGLDAHPLFQLLVYPWLDDRDVSESYHRFTDTPVWNSSLSKAVGPLINPDPSATRLAYRSPVEAESHADLPPAYIEVAEFDCLHDDGEYYAQILRDEDIDVEFHETSGTVHGFDMIYSAPTTQAMLAARVAFMRKLFESDS